MAGEQLILPHKLILNERAALSMTGVTEIISFDEEAVVLKTTLGTLMIQGSQLQLKQLTPDGGQVSVEGQVSSLVYEEPRKDGGWFRRLLG
jgi:sporulation protein YabP